MNKTNFVGIFLAMICLINTMGFANAETWTPVGGLNKIRGIHSLVSLASKPNQTQHHLVAIGGFMMSTDGTSPIEIYDADQRRWTWVTSLKNTRDLHQSVLLKDGRVLILGGLGKSATIQAINAVEIFDPKTKTLTDAAPMITARNRFTATVLNDGKVLVVGGNGEDAKTLSAAELYNPSTNTWTTTGALGIARDSHVATLLQDGRVLVTGGVNGKGFNLSVSEIFDPSGAQGIGWWDYTAFLNHARSFHTATLLADGRVLIVGGSTNGAIDLNSVEIIDPRNLAPIDITAIEAAPLSEARSGHVAILREDKTVIVSGGSNGPFEFRSSSEIFNAAEGGGIGKWSRGPSLNTARDRHSIAKVGKDKYLIIGGFEGFLDKIGSSELLHPTFQVSIYPNPSQGPLNINIGTNEASDVSIRVIDETGRVVLSEEQFSSGSLNVHYDLSGISAGLYSVSVRAKGTSEDQVSNLKWIRVGR